MPASCPRLKRNAKEGNRSFPHRKEYPYMVRHLLQLGLVLIGLSVLALALAPVAADDSKDATKWTPLFNGKDLTGWKIHPNPNPGAITEIITKEKDGKVIAYYGKLKSKDDEGKEG